MSRTPIATWDTPRTSIATPPTGTIRDCTGLRMRHDRFVTAKPVVLIGGASGAGKSTLAGRLKRELGLDHFLGTGFVRAIVQAETTPDDDPALFSMTLRSPDPVAHVVAQAHRLHRSVCACIDRARREGTSIVIEGSHLIPELYHDGGADLYFVLRAPDVDEHAQWIRGATHTLRTVNNAELANIRLIDEYFTSEAEKYGVTVAQADDALTFFSGFGPLRGPGPQKKP